MDDKPRASKVPQAIRMVVDQFEKAAGNYGRSGSPISPGEPIEARRSLNDQMGLGEREVAGRGRGAVAGSISKPEAGAQADLAKEASDGIWHTQLVVHLPLTQLPDGSVNGIPIATSSGNAGFDQLTLGQARTLGGHGLFGPPTRAAPHALGLDGRLHADPTAAGILLRPERLHPRRVPLPDAKDHQVARHSGSDLLTRAL